MEAKAIDLKKSVSLPRTDFPMKANLPQNEPKLLEKWREVDLYGQIRKASAGRPKYVLHDGPPYANGDIHLGHALNKIIKDFVVKIKTMTAFDSPYVPGWDCHGLPIEIKVEGLLGSKKNRIDRLDLRRRCREYAQGYVDSQSREFQRLGIFGQWDAPYLTMSASYQSIIAGAFVDFLDRGYVYRGLKSVNWCPNDRTALAEAEIEYENHTSPSIWVRFALESPESVDPRFAGRNVYGVIWTTTPWTLPANLGIAFNGGFEYSAVEHEGAVYIFASEMVKKAAEDLEWKDGEYTELFRLSGAKFERAEFHHPFLARTSLGMLGDHVTLEQGTGLVHTAPGHGQEDFEVSRRYGVRAYCPVDAGGRFYNPKEFPEYSVPDELLGKSIWEGNKAVPVILEASKALLHQRSIDHSYPHCWRCHKPTIFRATEQWFIGMDRNDLRSKALEAIRQVKWKPAWGEERIYKMVRDRPDWCISRQRTWGVPITVFYCADEHCHTAITDRAILDGVVNEFAVHGADIWYEKDAKYFLPEGLKCPSCGKTEFEKEYDILDVWFDSGSSHLAVLGHSPELPWPAQLYLEGGDQYRGWFHSSLLVGVGLRGSAPYTESATTGWTLDAQGRAMSKSAGNAIGPEKIIPKYGAEVLRLWVASVDFTEDVRLSEEILARLTEAYRKLRNTFRNLLGNLYDFDPATDALPVCELLEVDQWILSAASKVIEECRESYDNFAFHKAYHAIYNFAATELSSIHFDISKDRLYTAAPNSPARRSAQTAYHLLTHALARLLAPILTFTTEEVWGHWKRPAGAPESVHLAQLPEPAELTSGMTGEQKKRLENWPQLLDIRGQVQKSLEEARKEKVIGAPLEAHVHLAAGPDLYPLLSQYAPDLAGLFIVSQVSVSQVPVSQVPLEGQESASGSLGVRVERAQGTKCERCWKYTDDTGQNPRYPTVCAPCASALDEMFPDHDE